jgi:hypothetical protein
LFRYGSHFSGNIPEMLPDWNDSYTKCRGTSMRPSEAGRARKSGPPQQGAYGGKQKVEGATENRL